MCENDPFAQNKCTAMGILMLEAYAFSIGNKSPEGMSYLFCLVIIDCMANTRTMKLEATS